MTLLAVGDVIAAIAYAWVMHWSVLECVHLIAGAVALWGPLALVLDVGLRAEVPDRIVRLTLSIVASYALTTLEYFALAVLGVEAAFYPVHVTVAAAAIGLWWRRRDSGAQRATLLDWRRVDWPLAGLVVVSLLINVPYKTPFEPASATGGVTFRLFQDHLYHVGQVYELAKSLPPTQLAIRAGTPERAYHMFPHVATMLLGRFARQDDQLRVHLGYHYTVMEIGLCLLLFSIVKTLAGSTVAGYLAVGLFYVGALSTPPLVDSPFPYFYFTLFPDASSGLDPVRVTSPQMYSGIVVLYGVLLGTLVASIRLYQGERSRLLPLLLALMVAAASRFRIQIFVPLLPGFVLIALAAWWFRGERSYLAAAVTAVIVGALLLLETRSAVYLQGTGGVRLGYNNVGSIAWVNSWPGATPAFTWIQNRVADAGVRRWIWQVISLSAFVTLNMIGPPLLAATIAYLATLRAWREYRWFSLLCLWMVIASTVGAMLITTDYDSYSVGGQMLLHTRWYLYPFLALGLWRLCAAAQRQLGWPDTVWLGIAMVAIGAGVAAQRAVPPGGTRWDNPRFSPLKKLHLSADEWQVLQFLREQTPHDAVILSNKYVDREAFVYSGLTGRAAYLEAAGNPVDRQALRLNPADDRRQRIGLLWRMTDLDRFCELLASTGATHLVEYADHRLAVREPPCLQRLWESAGRTVTVWTVVREDSRPGFL